MEYTAINYQSIPKANTKAGKGFAIEILGLLFLQFIGAAFGLEIISVVGVAIVSLLVAYKYRHGSFNVVIIGLYLLVFQNFTIGIGAHLGNNNSNNLSFLTQIATVYFFVNAIYIVFSNKLSKANLYALFVIAVLLLMFIISKAVFMSKLVYFRNFALAPLAFIICYKHLSFPSINSPQFKKFIKLILCLSVIVFVFGIIMYFMPYETWKIIGIEEVYLAKGDTTIIGGFNGRFTTGFVNGVSIFRMASLYYEPVNLGYFFAFTLISSLIYHKYFNNKNKLYVIMNGLGLILTLGKGAYLLLTSIIAIILVYNTLGFRKRKISSITISSLLVFGLMFGLLWIYYVRIGGAASPHFWGIERTSKSIMNNLLGYGLGSGGNFGENGMDFSTGAETGLLSMIYQIGIFGFVVILGMYLIIVKSACKNGIKILAFVPLSLLFVSIFQENTFTPQCLLPILSLCCVQFYKKEAK